MAPSSTQNSESANNIGNSGEVEVITSSNIERDLALALKKLPKESIRAFLSLRNNFPGQNPLQNIVRSNGYPLGPNSDVGGVFATISRINHSCLPNAVHSWNSAKSQETVYAVRKIAAGDEITLSYHEGGPSADRQALLLEHFKFQCSCELCCLEPRKLKKSDARLIRAQSLDASIGNSQSVRDSPAKVLANCKSLSEIFAVQGIMDDRVSRLWYDCFQICCLHGDEARAAVFAERYCDRKRISAGEDSTDLLEMKPFVERPCAHPLFEADGLWKSRVYDSPLELEGEEFEKWLWRL